MLDEQDDSNPSTTSATPAGEAGAPSDDSGAASPEAKRAPRKRAPKKATVVTQDAGTTGDDSAADQLAAQTAAPAKRAPAKKSTAKKTGTEKADKAGSEETASGETGQPGETGETGAKKSGEQKAGTKKSGAKKSGTKKSDPKQAGAKKSGEQAAAKNTGKKKSGSASSPEAADAPAASAATEDSEPDRAVTPIFQAPDAAAAAPAEQASHSKQSASDKTSQRSSGDGTANQPGSDADTQEGSDEASETGGGGRRRRRRGGRRRRKPNGSGGGASDGAADGSEGDADEQTNGQDTAGESQRQGQGAKQGGQGKPAGQGKQGGSPDSGPASGPATGEDEKDSAGSRRRRRRRRSGEDGPEGSDDPQNTVTKVRKGRSPEDEITSVAGSTRLEAKKQRRREGREAGRRRAPIVSEAEFLARRESVERVMVIREREDLTQIAVLEDKVLVEHYVARESQTSLIGNVYLGRVQNVLPSMEAAFIDIGKGRNAVLYAGEVNWRAMGHKDGEARKIESVLSSGQPILVQVTKDPVGHKGARLTSQISLPGRFLVYVPDGNNSGISRKLPDTERTRLKALLKEVVPDTAGVIVRTAAEGAAEDELTRDVERLKQRWEDIEKKAKGAAPQLLYGEPDLTLKVVRDLFTEDFAKLVIEGDDAWDTVQNYVSHLAPDLADRLERYTPQDGMSVFGAYRVDEQIAKGLDRKVWLPSGGSLVIDRTEAMTVVDVNTGKFTGSGGNLEETVTKNNLEAAEEIVRQLRLRDIGGIIVVDFIDMVLESNRDLVLRRMVECLGRDRTRHQVAEVTSLGLVQMTRKRIGTGLLEAFSENCEACNGRGVSIKDRPVDPKGGSSDDGGSRRGRRSRGGRGPRGSGDSDEGGSSSKSPSPRDVAAMARVEKAESGAPESNEPAEAVEGPEIEAPEIELEEIEAPEIEVEEAAEAEQSAPLTEEVTAQPAEAPEPAPASTEEPTPEEPAGGESEELADQAPEESSSQPDAVAAAPSTTPTVVTRTRRRSASRPAGPPAETTVPDVSPESEDGQVDPKTADTEIETPPLPTVTHVSVKQRGARRR